MGREGRKGGKVVEKMALKRHAYYELTKPGSGRRGFPFILAAASPHAVHVWHERVDFGVCGK